MTSSVVSCFSQNYREAREKFLAALGERGIPSEAWVHPSAKGPAGEQLAVDVAYLGAAQASRLLVVISGTHGVEGFCGSGCQVALLREGVFASLPRETAVLLIHAINPYGFAHLRRVNEDNVDLNRNSIDHAHAPATSPDYLRLHPALIPADWDGPVRQAADLAIQAFVIEKGPRALQAAVSVGQYSVPEGLFYGGRELVWSTRTFQALMAKYARQRQRVALIDLHTGLGPKGHGELIYAGNDAVDGERTKRWFGDDVTSVHAGNSASAIVQGPMIEATRWAVPDAELTPVAIEYGTLPIDEVMTLLRAEQWLNRYGQVDSPLGQDIKRRFRDAFYVDTPDWKEAVMVRAREVVGKALAGLGE